MTMFKVVNGDIQQVDPRRELGLSAEKALSVEDEIESAVEAELEQEMAEQAQRDERKAQSEVLKEILAGLHEQNVGWALQRIPGLSSHDEVEEVRKLEKTHPRYPGGRTGVLNGLEERDGELLTAEPSEGLARGPKGPGELPRHVPAHPAGGTGIPCEHCSFMAGSAEGMEAHMEAFHPEVGDEEL